MATDHVKSNPRLSGFSLTELMVALTIALILTGLALPNLNQFVQQIRLSTAVGELHAAINLTRSEAIKRNGKVDLIAVDGNWANGWVIKNAADEEIIAHEALHKEFKINGKFTDGHQHIAFNGTGRSRSQSSSNVSQAGHIQISLGASSRVIVVNFLGRTRICNPAAEKNCKADSDN